MPNEKRRQGNDLGDDETALGSNFLLLVVQSGLSANFLWLLDQVMQDLDEVLARPLKIPVHSLKQAQRRLKPSEIQQLVADYRIGEDIKVLAKWYGVHRTTIANHLHENAVELRRQGITDVALPEVIHLYVAEGWSCQKLALRFNCDDESVRQALKRAGIKLRKPWER